MALQKSGVQLVAENESGFLGAMGRAQKSVQGFEGAVGKATPALGGMSFGSLTLATALGGTLVQAASAAVSGFFNLAKSAFQVTAAYETLGVSMQTLLAREIRNAGAATDMATAFDMAAPAARELLGWIEELAIKSPFDQAGVAAAYQTLQVYGFLSLGAEDVADAQAKGVITAQRLTEALINQAAVSSRGSETMGLVAYALGQIRTSGELLMQDLRQLTNAGVDVNAILGEMGYSLADVGKEAINSDEFILKFTETIERDLGGAAERQAGTLSGLANSLSDLGKKYLREFFGPINEGTGKIGGILGAVQPILQKFVDTLLNENVLKGVQTFGLLIGEGLSGGIATLEGILSGLTNTFAAPFTSAASSAFSWGSNIIVQLASGIINAAGSILISAINFVGGILANWFAPGSPPKIAPGLISWGQAAMGEFLHGFTEADFSVLKGIQQPLQSALQVMLQAGDIDAQGLADTYASITAGLAEALANGSDPSEIFDQIAESAGEFGPELAKLAELQFNLAGGVEAVKEAEDALAAARKAEEDAGLAAMQLTQEYNDLLRSGADDATLQAKLAEINAAETAKDLAGEQVDEAETQLDVAKSNLDVMQEQVRLQQELVNQLIELARLQAQAIPPEVPDPAGGGGAGGGAPGTPGLPEITLPDPGEAVASFLDEIIQKIKDAAAQMFQPILDAWNNMVAAVLDAWNNFIGNLNASGLITQLQSIWDSLVSLAQTALSILFEFIQGGLNTIMELWLEHRDQISRIWEKFWNLIQSIAGGILGLIVSNIDERLQEAVGFFETHRQQITSIINLFWSNIKTAFDIGLTAILGFTEDRLDSMQALWDTRGLQILGAVNRLWDNISRVFWEVLGILTDFVETQLLKVQTFWVDHGANVQLVIDRFLLTIGGLFDLFFLYISTAILFWVNYFADLWEEHGDKVTELVQSFLDAISAIFDTILGTIGASFDTWAALFKGDWEGFLQGISDFWEAIWDGVVGYLTASFNTLKTLTSLFVGAIITFFTDLWNTLIGHSIIPEMLDAMSNYFSSTFAYIEAVIFLWINTLKTNIELLKAWWSTTWDDIRQKITDVWDGIVTKVSERAQMIYDEVTGKIQEILDSIGGFVSQFKTAGGNLIDGMKEGVLGAVDSLISAVVKAIQDAIAAAKGALGMDSPSKVFMNIGHNVMFGLAEGIDQEKNAPVSAISDTISAMINPPRVSQAAGNTNNYNNSMSVNFNNNVGSGIDVAALDQHILRVVKQAFQR